MLFTFHCTKNKGQVHKSIVFERSVGFKPGIFLLASSKTLNISYSSYPQLTLCLSPVHYSVQGNSRKGFRICRLSCLLHYIHYLSLCTQTAETTSPEPFFCEFPCVFKYIHKISQLKRDYLLLHGTPFLVFNRPHNCESFEYSMHNCTFI